MSKQATTVVLYKNYSANKGINSYVGMRHFDATDHLLAFVKYKLQLLTEIIPQDRQLRLMIEKKTEFKYLGSFNLRHLGKELSLKCAGDDPYIVALKLVKMFQRYHASALRQFAIK